MTWMRESPSSAWLFERNRIPRFSTCKVPTNQCGGSPDSRIPITYLLTLCHRRIWVEFLALLIYARLSNVIERPVLIMPSRSTEYLQLVNTFLRVWQDLYHHVHARCVPVNSNVLWLVAPYVNLFYTIVVTVPLTKLRCCFLKSAKSGPHLQSVACKSC